MVVVVLQKWAYSVQNGLIESNSVSLCDVANLPSVFLSEKL